MRGRRGCGEREAREAEARRRRESLGESDARRLDDIKAWIDAHPKRDELLAALLADEREE